MKKRSVLIVDDHPIVRQGLSMLVNRESDLEVCAEAEDAQAALRSVESLQPDIAVVDIALKGISGLDLIKNLKARFPTLPVLVLSMHDEAIFAERALYAGAQGYIMKREASEKVIEAIHRVLEGQIYLSEPMTSLMLKKAVSAKQEQVSSPLGSLTDREYEVFQLIGQGYRTRKIAEQLNLSVKTVESHRENIKRKLNLRDAAALLRHATQWVQSNESAT